MKDKNPGATSVSQIKAMHPMPWRVVASGHGVMRVIDSAGNEVLLMTILDFLGVVTKVMARQGANS